MGVPWTEGTALSRRRSAMLEEQERPQASRGDSRTSDPGSAGTGPRTAVGQPDTPISSGYRSARNKRGLFHRGGVALPAAGLAVLLVVTVWGAVQVLGSRSGANSIVASIEGIGSSKQAAALAQEADTIEAMMSASKALTVAAVPAHTDPDQIMADNSMSTADETGGTDVTTLAVPANATASEQAAQSLMASFGFSVSTQYSCLFSLWEQESGWNVTAENPVSGAYGIPQALPADKMASVAADWQTDASTQIKWGLGYIKSIYGTPCIAWAHEEADGFY